MAKDRRDCEAAGAFDVHEEGAGAGYEGLEFVLLGFGGRRRIEQVYSENLAMGLVEKSDRGPRSGDGIAEVCRLEGPTIVNWSSLDSGKLRESWWSCN